MYTNFSFITTQNSHGQEKKKKINKIKFEKYKWQSHSFGNNFCHKPKGYKSNVDRGERHWNNK